MGITSIQQVRMTPSRRGFLLATAAALSLAACGQRAGDEGVAEPSDATPPAPLTPDEEVLSWLRANRAVLSDFTPQDPAVRALGDRLASARVVGLGEVTHGSHEDVAMKASVTLDLVQRHGFRSILIEDKRAVGVALDAWISGKAGGSAAEVLTTSRAFEVNRTQAMADLLDGLRAFNAGQPEGDQVRFHAIDCQDGVVDAAAALEALRRIDAAAADQLEQGLAPIADEIGQSRHFSEVIKSLTTAEIGALITALSAAEAVLASTADAEALYMARVARQAFDSFRREGSDGDPAQIDPAYASQRDIYMGENILGRIASSRGVYLAHNIHVSAVRPTGAYEGYVPSGAVVRDALGKDYVSVMCEFGSADFLAKRLEFPWSPVPGRDAPYVVTTRKLTPGTLGTFLAGAGPGNWWADWRDLPDTDGTKAWREAGIRTDWPGFVDTEQSMAPMFPPSPALAFWDVLVWFEQLTPAQRV